VQDGVLYTIEGNRSSNVQGPGEKTWFRGSVREGYVEGFPGSHGVGKSLIVRRIVTAIESNAKAMLIGVGRFDETVKVSEVFKALGDRVGSFAAEVNSRASEYQRLWDSLNEQLVQVSTQLNNFGFGGESPRRMGRAK
jgi:hypothetical protein